MYFFKSTLKLQLYTIMNYFTDTDFLLDIPLSGSYGLDTPLHSLIFSMFHVKNDKIIEYINLLFIPT